MMKRLLARRWLSTRMYLVLGLSALAVSVVLAATFLGLVPDAETQTRQHRTALAETIAITTSALLNDAEPEALHATLSFLRERNPALLSIGVRAESGDLLIDLGEHAARWSPGPHAASTSAEIIVPVWQAGQAWGRIELSFQPLRADGWLGQLQEPSVKLAAFVFFACGMVFLGYLKRMLRELDPSTAVPQRVQAAYDTLTEGLLVLDPKGTIVMANGSAGRLLDPAHPGALLYRSPSDFSWGSLDGAPLAREELPWERALATGQPQNDQFLTVTDTAGLRYSLRANCSPMLDDRRQPLAFVISFQDITQLERHRTELKAAKEHADAASQAKSQFLANMSHEIRTPMNAILGFTEVLRRGGLARSGDAARHLDIIHSSGKHLLNLINDILDLSKVESGHLEAERTPFAPHAVAHEVIKTLAERAQHKALALDIEFSQALPAQISGDAARLRQILTNLVGNAIKFTERGGVRVVLRMQPQAGAMRYCIDVCDSGIGIPTDKLESVFEPFVQAESSTTRRFGGTGLGLTISRGFARAMGGDIVASSVLGQGTTFSVWLDAGDLSATPMLQPEALALEAEGPASAPPGVRWSFPNAQVLVVDDGAENRQLVRVLLEEVGLHVSEAENGQLALDAVAQGRFDLVLMDMQMPVMDGQTATRLLRERGCLLPVIALTANAMKGFEHELESSGFSGYLTKPIDVDALLQELAQRLGGKAVALAVAEAEAEAEATTEATAEPEFKLERTSARSTDRTYSADRADCADSADDTPLVSRLASHAKLGRIVARFVEQLPTKRVQMEEAAARGDMAELAALAHWLKGAGGSMGFDALFEPAKALEEAAQQDDNAAARLTLDDIRRIEARIRLGAAVPLAVHAEASG